MARSKRAPALFEVLSKSKDPPTWLKKDAPAEAEPGQKRPEIAPDKTPAPPEPDADTPLDEAEGFPAGRKAAEIDGRVFRLALTSTQAALVIFALATCLVLVYWVGHDRGYRVGQEDGYRVATNRLAEGDDEIAAALRQPVTTGLTDGIGESPVITVQPEPAAVDREPRLTAADPAQTAPSGESGGPDGEPQALTYLVVQDFPREADAERARKFLLDSGIETKIYRSSGRWPYQLVAMPGYDCDDPAQKQQFSKLWRRVRALGEQYMKSGGAYKLEGYDKKF
jgi:hypothetical protein